VKIAQNVLYCSLGSQSWIVGWNGQPQNWDSGIAAISITYLKYNYMIIIRWI